MGLLKVQIREASLSVSKHRHPGSLFCKLMVGAEKAKTKRKKKTRNPVWNEVFTFKHADFGVDQLMIQVLEYIRFGKTDFLGWVVISLTDLAIGTENKFQMPLQGDPTSYINLSVLSGDLAFLQGEVSSGTVSQTQYEFKSSATVQSGITTIPNKSLADQWYMRPETVEVQQQALLGTGAFGAVYKGTIFGKAVAIKKLNKQDLSQEVLNEFAKEIKLLCQIRHPNMILFMGACTDLGHLAIVTEYLPRGNLETLLQNRILSMFQKFTMAKDIALALNWLHLSYNILHLDLKPANLLVDENWNVKLADFGLANLKQNIQSGQLIGTPWFMAPEILLKQSFDESADVYSFGIVLWQLYTDEINPYGDRFKNLVQLIDGVAHQRQRPIIPANCPPQLIETLKMCWDPNPYHRVSFQVLINRGFIDNILLSQVFSPEERAARDCWSRLCDEKIRAYVTSGEFLAALQQTLNVPHINEIQKECLKALLRNDVDEVGCEKFSQVLEWIGPLTRDDKVLKNVEKLLRRPDFFGPISGRQAELILKNQPSGTYLVRFSLNRAGDYAIAMVDSNQEIIHYKIQRIDSFGNGERCEVGGAQNTRPNRRLMIGEHQFESLESLMNEVSRILEVKVNLRVCPGHPYHSIFTRDYPQRVTYTVFLK